MVEKKRKVRKDKIPEPHFTQKGRYLYEYGVTSAQFKSWPDNPRFEVWAHLPKCGRNKCPAWKRCLNLKKDYCVHIRRYVTGMLLRIEQGYVHNPLTVFQLMRIGSELVPLYVQLARVQIHEQNADNVVIEDDNVKPKMHWAWREVQALLKQIASLWRDIGLSVKSLGARDHKIDIITGRTETLKKYKQEEPVKGYYEDMEKDIEREKALIEKREKEARLKREKSLLAKKGKNT